MRFLRSIAIASIFSLLVGCSGTLVSDVELDESAGVSFELVSGKGYENFSSREWEVYDDLLFIYADMSGDGRVGYAKIHFDYSSDSNEPQITRESDHYNLSWPFERVETVLIGDVDKDGDADVIIDTEDEPYYLINKVKKYRHLPPDDEEFNGLLKDIGDLVATGRVDDAYNMAFDIGLGSPHSWSPPGEGEEGLYDKHSVVNLDKGNCVTWMEQIMAMINSGGTYAGFFDYLMSVRYLDGIKEYPLRNHFQSADWIPNNIAAGNIIDLLPSMLDDDVPYVEETIDKKAWYAAKAALEGDFPNLSEDEAAGRLDQFQELGAYMGPEDVKLGYFPFDKMVMEVGGEYLLDPNFVLGLPQVSLFNVVNEGFEIKNSDGEWMTDLIVSHTGFLVKDRSGNILVHHSTNKTDTSLVIMAQEDFLSFLVHRYLDSGTTKAVGLHLSKTLIKTPSAIVNLKQILY